jgi:hypothetical protein
MALLAGGGSAQLVRDVGTFSAIQGQLAFGSPLAGSRLSQSLPLFVGLQAAGGEIGVTYYVPPAPPAPTPETSQGGGHKKQRTGFKPAREVNVTLGKSPRLSGQSSGVFVYTNSNSSFVVVGGGAAASSLACYTIDPPVIPGVGKQVQGGTGAALVCFDYVLDAPISPAPIAGSKLGQFVNALKAYVTAESHQSYGGTTAVVVQTVKNPSEEELLKALIILRKRRLQMKGFSK